MVPRAGGAHEWGFRCFWIVCFVVHVLQYAFRIDPSDARTDATGGRQRGVTIVIGKDLVSKSDLAQ